MVLDALLTHCHLADGRLVDIGIAGGRIATIGEDAAASLSNRVPILDIGGDLVLPGLVDGHMHLDKTLMGLPWMPHMAGPTRMSRIDPRASKGGFRDRCRHGCADARCRASRRPRSNYRRVPRWRPPGAAGSSCLSVERADRRP
jgi:imidazolonepropionase-like amidohydrolase